MKVKINLESWNLAKISQIEHTWKFQSNFIHISCHQLSTAVKSLWQLIKVDENEKQPRELKFGAGINFSVYIKIPINFSFYQLSKNCQQLITGGNMKKMKINLESWNLAQVSALVGRWKFHSIFFVTAVISCQKLSTAVDSW